MKDLIQIHYDNADRPTVSGRELHEALGVETPYTTWVKRMCEYGFSENVDFCNLQIWKAKISTADRTRLTTS